MKYIIVVQYKMKMQHWHFQKHSHIYIHAYIHTYIFTYIHTYIHTYIWWWCFVIFVLLQEFNNWLSHIQSTLQYPVLQSTLHELAWTTRFKFIISNVTFYNFKVWNVKKYWRLNFNNLRMLTLKNRIWILKKKYSKKYSLLNSFLIVVYY